MFNMYVNFSLRLDQLAVPIVTKERLPVVAPKLAQLNSKPKADFSGHMAHHPASTSASTLVTSNKLRERRSYKCQAV